MIRRWFWFIAVLACLGCNEPTAIQPGPSRAKSAEEFIQLLAASYRNRDIDLFASLLANDPDNKAEYLFILDPNTQEAEKQWGYTEMVRIHQRMFEPENTPAGQSPVPPEFWVTSITIALTA